jgi:hypothetical protein
VLVDVLENVKFKIFSSDFEFDGILKVAGF